MGQALSFSYCLTATASILCTACSAASLACYVYDVGASFETTTIACARWSLGRPIGLNVVPLLLRKRIVQSSFRISVLAIHSYTSVRTPLQTHHLCVQRGNGEIRKRIHGDRERKSQKKIAQIKEWSTKCEGRLSVVVVMVVVVAAAAMMRNSGRRELCFCSCACVCVIRRAFIWLYLQRG